MSNLPIPQAPNEGSTKAAEFLQALRKVVLENRIKAAYPLYVKSQDIGGGCVLGIMPTINNIPNVKGLSSNGGRGGGDVFSVRCTGSGDPPHYTVTTTNNEPLVTAATPLNYRSPFAGYLPGTIGFGFYDDQDNFQFFVIDEHPDQEIMPVAVVTGTDNGSPPCYTITPTNYLLTKVKVRET